MATVHGVVWLERTRAIVAPVALRMWWSGGMVRREHRVR